MVGTQVHASIIQDNYVCDYAAPPQGCSYVKGPDYNLVTHCGMELSCPNIDIPTISGVSGPQTLNVNQTGTWTVKATDASGGNLTYSVAWGDDDGYGLAHLGTAFYPTQQSATFTHSYSQAGSYTPKFTVINESGKSASTSLSVNVGGEIIPSFAVLTPNGGENWVKDTYKTITWQDLCASGVSCTSVMKNYDISLVPYYAPCTTRNCSKRPIHEPYKIAQRVGNLSYDWKVGNVMNSETISDGLYSVKVCIAGSEKCVMSDNYFSIISSASICPSGCICNESSTTCLMTSTDDINNPITRTLKRGMKGDDVKALQNFLGLDADGSYGRMTASKVMEWQAQNGLKSDGVFGTQSRVKSGLGN